MLSLRHCRQVSPARSVAETIAFDYTYTLVYIVRIEGAYGQQTDIETE